MSDGIEVIWAGVDGNAALASNWGGKLARDTSDTITIGSNSTQAITSNLGAVPAFETLTLAGNAVNNETLVIDAKTYTWKTAITGGDDVDGNVKVGANASGSLDNLIAAINLASGSGSTYAANMTVHPTAYATAETGDAMDAIFKIAGTGGNGTTTTEAMTQGSWGAGTMSGGAASGLHVGYFYVENGYDEDIMNSGTRASINFTDALFESDISTFFWAPTLAGVTSIVTVNSGNLVSAVNVDTAVNFLLGIEKSAIEIIRGRVIYNSNGANGDLRSVRMISSQAILKMTSSSVDGLITALEMTDGVVESNASITSFTMSGGSLNITTAPGFATIGFTIGTITGGSFTTNIGGNTLNAKGGISDFRRIRTTSALTQLFTWPGATVLKNENFVATTTDHKVGGGTSSGP